MTPRLFRLLAGLAAAALVLGATVTAAAPASASTWMGTLKVQLAKPTGADWHKKGVYVEVAGMKNSTDKVKRTNAQGLATVKVPPGKYTITVQMYRTDYTYAIATQDYIAIARGQVKTIGMKIYQGGVVEGKVTKPDGKPLPGATVAVTKADGVVYGYTTTDKKGRYTLRGLQTGRYYVIFNQRGWNDPKSKILQNYGWSYWRGSTLEGSHRVLVYQQNRYAGATTTSDVNGRVGTRTTDVTVTLASPVNATSRLALDNVTANGTYLAAQSVYSPLVGGTTVTQKVHRDVRYRIGVTRGTTTYYYTGEGQTLTTDVNRAAFVWISGSAASYHLGPFPD
ncbi:carboxypeptidase-like regulatory domain-containing protein [Galbitalea sp. SE-J8]|uniref:carboxypeptidase-like regulatory domain-containing protein n=1 Tax=Galbitalea sp. SE-J8 TaxID=3054952 RepID=UPI00259D04B8|nr:carboxypeptidase-like regulatory domain-containing protein [Galbitalea sp. SE-J8]MDM4762742.1 carboxypeptidase-like regulatory domain-containing protein [Galbitalea sp. SE-J8]